MPVTDSAVLHGAGLFETIRAENGTPFLYDRHLDRLTASAAALLKPVTAGDLPSADDIRQLLQRNDLRAARVRLTLTAGDMRGGDKASHRVIVTAQPLTRYEASAYENGVRCVLSPHQVSISDPLARHKTTSYLSRLLALRRARDANCFEAIWFSTNNELAEGSISNVLLVRDGKILTPPLDAPILPGIMRGLVLEEARRSNIEVVERPITINDLLDADEVLLTNSMIQVLPIIRIERSDIGDGKVGTMAKSLLEVVRDRVRRECNE